MSNWLSSCSFVPVMAAELNIAKPHNLLIIVSATSSQTQQEVKVMPLSNNHLSGPTHLQNSDLTISSLTLTLLLSGVPLSPKETPAI